MPTRGSFRAKHFNDGATRGSFDPKRCNEMPTRGSFEAKHFNEEATRGNFDSKRCNEMPTRGSFGAKRCNDEAFYCSFKSKHFNAVTTPVNNMSKTAFHDPTSRIFVSTVLFLEQHCLNIEQFWTLKTNGRDVAPRRPRNIIIAGHPGGMTLPSKRGRDAALRRPIEK
jgi:hypothetical protein